MIHRCLLLSLLSLMLTWGQPSPMAAPPDLYDLFFDDGTSQTLNTLSLNFPQAHVIAGADDEDWAAFYAQENLPYTVKVQNVGAGLDPELWLYGPGIPTTGYPWPVDQGAYGEDESVSFLKWPATGIFLVRVRTAALAGDSTSYTLTVAGDWGANIALATISGIKVGAAQSSGVVLKLPDTYEDPLSHTTKSYLYTQSRIAVPGNAFASEGTPWIQISGFGDPRQHLEQPWVKRWAGMFPGNLTITWVGVHPPAQPALPLEIAIQMRRKPVEMALTDRIGIEWPSRTYRDVPLGAWPSRARVYRWNAGGENWDLFDPSPLVEERIDGWVARTSISSLAFGVFGESDLFAVGVVDAPRASAADWTLFE